MKPGEANPDDFDEDVGHRMESIFENARERLEPIDRWVRRNAEERPLVMLAGAMAIGYVIGRIMRHL